MIWPIMFRKKQAKGTSFPRPETVKENTAFGQENPAESVRQKLQKLIKRPWRIKRKDNVLLTDLQKARRHSSELMGPHRVDSAFVYYKIDYVWRMIKMKKEMKEMNQLGKEGYAKKKTFEVYAGIRSHEIIQEIKELKREFQASQSRCYSAREASYSNDPETFPELSTALYPLSPRFSIQYSPVSSVTEKNPDLREINKPNVTGSTSTGVTENGNKPEAIYMGLKLIREPLDTDDRSIGASQDSKRPSPALIRKSSNIQDWPLREHSFMENSPRSSTHEGCYQPALSGMSFRQLLPEDRQKHGSVAQCPPIMEHEKQVSISFSVDGSAHSGDCVSTLTDYQSVRNEIAAVATADGQSCENEKQMESPQMMNHSVDSGCDVDSEVKVIAAATPESGAVVTPNMVPTFVSHSESDADKLIDANEESECFTLYDVDKYSEVNLGQKETVADHTEDLPTCHTHQETPDQSSSIQTDHCNPRASILTKEHAEDLSKAPAHEPALSSFLLGEMCLSPSKADSQQVEVTEPSQRSESAANSCEDRRFHQLQDYKTDSIFSTTQNTVDETHRSTPKTITEVDDPEETVSLVFNSGAKQPQATSENATDLEDSFQDTEPPLCAVKGVDHLQSPEKGSQSNSFFQPPAVAVEKECKQWIRGKDGIHESLQHTSQSGLCHNVSEAEEVIKCLNSDKEFENLQDGDQQAEYHEEQNKTEVSTPGLPNETDDLQGSMSVYSTTTIDVNKDPIISPGADPIEDEGWGVELEAGNCSKKLDTESCTQIMKDKIYLPKSMECLVKSQGLQDDAEDLNPGANVIMNDDGALNLEVSNTGRYSLDCDMGREGDIEIGVLKDVIDDVQLTECNEQSPGDETCGKSANNPRTVANGCSQPIVDQEIVNQHTSGDTFPIPSLHEHSGREENNIFKDKSPSASNQEGYHFTENEEIDQNDLCDNFDWSSFEFPAGGCHPASILDNSEIGVSNQLSGLHNNSGDEHQESLIKVPDFLTSFSGAALADDDFTLKLPHQLKGWAGDEEASGSLMTEHQELNQNDSIVDEV